jgi:hypothetical protein
VATLAALATVMADPIAHLSKLRQSRAFDRQFDRVLEQDNTDAHCLPTSYLRTSDVLLDKFIR